MFDQVTVAMVWLYVHMKFHAVKVLNSNFKHRPSNILYSNIKAWALAHDDTRPHEYRIRLLGVCFPCRGKIEEQKQSVHFYSPDHSLMVYMVYRGVYVTSYQGNFASPPSSCWFPLRTERNFSKKANCSITFYLVYIKLPNYIRVTKTSAHVLSWNFKYF